MQVFKLFIAIVILLFFSIIIFLSIQKKQYEWQSTLSLSLPSITPTVVTLPPLSLAQIFQDNHDWVATLSAENVRTMIATGDIIPARSVNFKVHQYKNFLWPYEQTSSMTKKADITFINLETPLVKDCGLTQEGMTFCGDAGNVDGLVFAGVDVVSLANNHAANYGVSGVTETVKRLNEQGILTTGVKGPTYQDIRGIRFAFLGYNDVGRWQGISNADEDKIVQEIKEAKKNADVVIVAYHWGIEYVSQPSERQKELGHFTIDSGANLVIGNHPHWIQPIEIYKGKLITYAHGNFIFDQMWSQKTREGVVGRYTFYNNQLIDVEYFPIEIKDYGQPYFLEGQRKKDILSDMQLQS